MGHLVVMDDSEAQFALTALSRRLWAEMAPACRRDCEDEETGTLWVAADEEERGHVRKKAAFYRERGVAVEELSGEDVRARRADPAARPRRGPARSGRPRALSGQCGALAARARGGEGRRAPRGRSRPSRSSAGSVETRKGSLDAGVVVNAAGGGAGC